MVPHLALTWFVFCPSSDGEPVSASPDFTFFFVVGSERHKHTCGSKVINSQRGDRSEIPFDTTPRLEPQVSSAQA